MSHFSKVETKITDLIFLKKAITDMELAYEEGNLKAKGWLWKRAKADLIIPTRSGCDIGFKYNGTSYDVVADWDSIGDIDQQSFVNELSQRYAYNVVSDTLTQQGFTIAEERAEDGKIRLTMQRAS